eukprot:GILK01006386.1.p1 GENE.GILK01006386.1~~GILK01006386.1.p1  ORF type:complete len:1470 (-),score=342.66 GILK01006386.1:187-3951(-)
MEDSYAPEPPVEESESSTNQHQIHTDIDSKPNTVKDMSSSASVSVKTEAQQAEMKSLASSASDWWSVRQNNEESVTSSQESATTLGDATASGVGSQPLPLDSEGDMRFFWIDAHEDPYSNPGIVYLFGKVAADNGTFASCCVAVHHMERNLFVLPRAYADEAIERPAAETQSVMFEVYQELDKIRKSRFPEIKKFSVKGVVRDYTFEKSGVTHGKNNYMKVVYPAEYPVLPTDLKGETFSHIFGTNSSMMELLILKRNLMGPCWLTIKKPRQPQFNSSWCRFEAHVDSKKQIIKMEEQPDTPLLTVVSLNLKTVKNKQHANEVCMATLMVHNSVQVDGGVSDNRSKYVATSAIRKLDGVGFPFDLEKKMKEKRMNTQMCGSEKALLNFLIAKLHKIDPDVIVGHNICGFDIDVLLHRINANKVAHWSRLGRLKRTQMPKLSGQSSTFGGSWAGRQATCGRLLCDTYLAARELLRETTYTLSELARRQLNMERQEIDFNDIPLYYNQSQSVVDLILHTENDAFLSFELMFKLQVLPLTKQLTCLAGNLWARSLQNARAERNEFLLLHEFHSKKYICPDRLVHNSKAKIEEDHDDDDDEAKPTGGKGKRRKKAAYSGGLVLEPKSGLYDKYVLLLDFNSLYPSIIMEYNLCFTTVDRPSIDGAMDIDAAAEGAQEDDVHAPFMGQLPEEGTARGILPKVIETLVQRRRQVKQLQKTEKDPVKFAQLEIRQKALKLTANSMYGCLGFTHSRFYAKPIAALITQTGREILQRTVDLVQDQLQLEVIYGDTDSIMIHTGLDDIEKVYSIGNQVKKEVNKLYKCLEIEMDGIFKTMLLLRKKKYAALVVQNGPNGIRTTIKETKGLDLVRRDWCDLSKEIGNYVLDQILSGNPREEVLEAIHNYLGKMALAMKNNQVLLKKYVITKQLTKAPEEYPDGKSQPHVQVAKAMIAAGKNVRVGNHIPYIICKGEQTSFADRAHHPDEIAKSNGALEIDVNWYLTQQVHPPVARLCEPIDGTDSGRIADFLGLEASKFVHRIASSTKSWEDAYFASSSNMDDETKFSECSKLYITCRKCRNRLMFGGVHQSSPTNPNVRMNGFICSQPGCNGRLESERVHNAVLQLAKSSMDSYYEGWLMCEDIACAKETRQLPLNGSRCLMPGCRGKMRPKFGERSLHLQLQYLQSLFDVAKVEHKLALENKRREKDNIAPIMAPVLSEEDKRSFASIKESVTQLLSRSAYNFISCDNLFSFMTTTIKAPPMK